MPKDPNAAPLDNIVPFIKPEDAQGRAGVVKNQAFAVRTAILSRPEHQGENPVFIDQNQSGVYDTYIKEHTLPALAEHFMELTSENWKKKPYGCLMLAEVLLKYVDYERTALQISNRILQLAKQKKIAPEKTSELLVNKDLIDIYDELYVVDLSRTDLIQNWPHLINLAEEVLRRNEEGA
jgi:hypothetical protein